MTPSERNILAFCFVVVPCIILAICALSGCASTATKSPIAPEPVAQEAPIIVKELPDEIPPEPEYRRVEVPYTVPVPLLSTDPLSGSEQYENVEVPERPNERALVCFNLPSRHIWQCVYLFDNGAVDLLVVEPSKSAL